MIGQHGAVVGGVAVIGPLELVHDHPAALVVLTTGRPDNYVSRPLIAARLGLPDARYARSSIPARVGPRAPWGWGRLLAHADLTADVVVGRHVA